MTKQLLRERLRYIKYRILLREFLGMAGGMIHSVFDTLRISTLFLKSLISVNVKIFMKYMLIHFNESEIRIVFDVMRIPCSVSRKNLFCRFYFINKQFDKK